MKVYFYGGASVRITIAYYDTSTDVITVTYNGNSFWMNYPLDAGKTIKRIRWENLEWWNPGRVWVDIATVYFS